MRLSFREWLDSALGAGEIWDSRSNADQQYGRRGAKSRIVANGEKSAEATFDPDELFLGKRNKKGKPRINTQTDI